MTPDSGRETSPLVVLDNLVKDYPGVRALRGASMDLRRGEVHALVGENGAGKSTLIRILSGDVLPDGGSIAIDGRPVVFAGPMDARRHGIVTIFQELMIVPELTVAENIFLGNEPASFGAFYSRREAERRAAEILRTLGAGLNIRPSQQAGSLSTAQKQLVEIARALALRAPVIVMDEPTAALSEKEATALRQLIVRLRSEGTSILYVSHRLDEVMEIANRVTVLRGGERIATLDIGAIAGTGELIGLMVGRPLAELFPPRNAKVGEVAFSVSNLTRRGVFEDISFNVRAGEVVGFAGLVGAGRTEVMRAIFGADAPDSGVIRKKGQPVDIRRPRDAIASGIAYLPEDRKDHGLVLSMSGAENVVMASLGKSCTAGIVSWKAVRRNAQDIAGPLQFRGQLDALAGTASGGNQQKLVIGKWVLTGADVLIFDEPTRGIDVGAKAEVYRLIHRLASEGAAVILVSSELSELMNVCHRIYVMSGGRILDEVSQEEFDEQRILAGAFAAHLAGKPASLMAGAA
ncbi:sugar ABC transporter ATP-binding protein [Bradyrhizobium sp. dw_78]|uniref:sugar ABC transporter ATP-binding protein n=1 Tax=Bradyrhizobium sp. dw_78 TaxID=2719793 RepID=UPI001BD5CEF7